MNTEDAQQPGRRPHILISGNGDLSEYVAAIERGGGTATAGYLPDSSGDFDALLLAGGNDIDPSRYGEDFHGAVDVDFKRDAHEVALLDAFSAAGKPIFGICRGYQLLNVYFGGTLIQDLPSEPEHVSRDGRVVCHKIVTEPDSAARMLFGESFAANSFHHQGIGRIADGFRVTMRRPEDGLPEAIEHMDKPWFGVQFHPEKMTAAQTETAAGDPLFGYFLSLCRK